MFSAPAKDYAVRVVDEGNYSNVHLIVSDYNFKFYGRFQVCPILHMFRLFLIDVSLSLLFNVEEGKNTSLAVRSFKKKASKLTFVSRV